MSPNYGLGVDPVNQVHSFDITKWSHDHVKKKVCKPEKSETRTKLEAHSFGITKWSKGHIK